MNTSIPLRGKFCLLALLASAALHNASFAQQAPVPDLTPPSRTPESSTKKLVVVANKSQSANDEVIVLSPFVVNAEKDTGYEATSTLAGTRLKTDLRDIATSISVVTQQFLRDTGATDTQSLLTYTTGTEVAGLAGNYSGASISTAGISQDTTAPSATTRLRGLAAASEARNFFATSIPMDTYNVDRVEINRGANSVLFGTGSPAGIINSSLKQALMKNSAEVDNRLGSYGSVRTSFDINHQIIAGELAVRIDGLNKQTNFQQEYTFSNDKRIYAAMTYAPRWARTKNGVLSGTVFRASNENGARDSEVPRILPPFDRISLWFNPAFGFAPKLSWDASTSTASATPFIGAFNTAPAATRAATVFFSDPNSGAPGRGYSINGVPIMGAQGVGSNMTNPTGTHFEESLVSLSASAVVLGKPDASFYFGSNLSDAGIFDFRHYLLEGPNRHEYANFGATNVSLEQRFFDDRAGIEFSYSKQRISNGNYGLSPSGLNIDVNTVLLNGIANPNYGRPYTSGVWSDGYARSEAETRRTTAYYRFDFADVLRNKGLAKWLGVHTLTLLDERTKTNFLSISGPRYTDPNYTFGNNLFITDISGATVFQQMYLGSSLANTTNASDAHVVGVNAVQLPTASAGQSFQFRNQTAGSPFVVTPLYIQDNGLIPYNSATNASKGGSNTRDQAFVFQSKFLWDTVVTTYGWRRDDVDTFTAALPKFRGPSNNLLLDPISWPYPISPTTSVSGTTSTKSLVLHTPDKWINHVPLVSSFSLRYTTSDNFVPGATRYNSNMDVVTPPSGKTKDYGFSLGLAHDRINLNVTWYETSQNNATARGIPNLTNSILNAYRLFVNMTGLGLNPNASQIIVPPQYLLDAYGFSVTNGSAAFTNRSDILLTQNYVSKGVEFEAQVKLTKRWRLFLDAARQSAVTANTGSAFEKLFFEQKFNGQTLFENWTGPAGQASAVDEAGGRLATYSLQTIVNPFYTQALQDGGPTQELRKWRANAVTNYDFDGGSFLKGFSVGTGVRWQDKVAIGFPVTSSPTGSRVSDVAHPFYGPCETNVDAWIRYQRSILKGKVGLMLEFRVYNLTSNDALIPVAAQPDGSIASYRIPSDRRIEFTTRLAF